MLLAIDSGNTTTQFVLIKDDKIIKDWRCGSDPKKTPDDYMVWISALMQHDGVDTSMITACIIASVVPRVQEQLIRFCRLYIHEPMVVGHKDVDLRLKALIPDPTQVGVDRLVNGVAVRYRYSFPAIVVDFGTATSFDIFDDQGNFAGGVLSPGIELSVEALYLGADKLPRFDIVKPSNVVGKATIPALQSGTYWGYIGLVEGILRRIGNEQKEKAFELNKEFLPSLVVATGGLASLIASEISQVDHIDTSLTIEGLRMIYHDNKAA